MGLASATLKAVPTGDVAFGRDIIADVDLLDQFAHFDHGACKLMAEGNGWFDAVAAPVRPI